VAILFHFSDTFMTIWSI